MNALTKNPETGFLESKSRIHASFDSDKKVRFLEILRQCAEEKTWPRISDICKIVGIGSQTFFDHLKADAEFKRAYEDAVSPVEDQLAENLYKQGMNANGITANIFLLKSRWSERWGDKQQISVDIGNVKDIFRRSETVIEAEIVDPPVITGSALKHASNCHEKVVELDSPSEK